MRNKHIYIVHNNTHRNYQKKALEINKCRLAKEKDTSKGVYFEFCE